MSSFLSPNLFLLKLATVCASPGHILYSVKLKPRGETRTPVELDIFVQFNVQHLTSHGASFVVELLGSDVKLLAPLTPPCSRRRTLRVSAVSTGTATPPTCCC